MGEEELAGRQQHVVPVVAGIMLSIFLVALDGTIVSTAMPTIVGNLGGFSLYAWVPAVYLLTSAVSTPIYGKLSDLYGRKPILFTGIALFLLGSVTSGAANSMILLIIFRALQGLGAGAVFPVTTTIVGDMFTLEQRARIQGLFGSVWGVSSVVGPLAGGFLVDNVGWRWIFYLNVPVGLAGALLIALFFHERGMHREHKLDIAGATFLTVALTTVLLVLIEGGQQWDWVAPQTGVLLAVSIASFALFIRQERRAPEPALPLDLFTIRIIGVSVLGSFFIGAMMVSVSYEVPLLAQGVLGQDALHAGFSVAPMSLGWPLASSVAGRFALRVGYRVTAVGGLLIATVGVALLLLLTQHSSYVEAAIFSFFIGAGLGMSSTPMLVAVQSAVSWQRRGVATAASMFVRNFGGLVGLAIMGAIINHVAGKSVAGGAADRELGSHGHAALPPAVLAHIEHTLFMGLHAAFYAALATTILGLLAAALLPGGSAREHEVRANDATSAESLEETSARVPARGTAPATPRVARDA